MRLMADGRPRKKYDMKHIPLLLALVVLVLLLSGTSASRPAPAVGSEARAVAADKQTASGVSGDVNCGGTVDAIDALLILRSVAGLPVSANCINGSGDVNCSGTIDAIDALLILRQVAGLPVNLPAGCTPIGQAIGPAPSSFDKIDEALADGTISDEQALLYRMYASFGDSRLPPQYKGDDSGVTENPAMGELPDAWGGLSQDTKDGLAPFLKTPAEAGSWLELQPSAAASQQAAASAIELAAVSPPTVKAKVWYQTSHPGDAATAQKYADALESTIWPNLTQLMGRPPLPDCGAACPSGGGDDRLDIYLVNENVRSYTKWNPPEPPTCKATPAFIVIGRNESVATLAHEFMHAVQFAFGRAGTCGEYKWFVEASAQWAMDYVYPSGPPGGPPNEEQQAAPAMLEFPEFSLDVYQDPHWYGAYLLPFYLAWMKGQPEIVRTIWEKFEITANSLEAVNDALLEHLLGGFEEVWPKVVLYDWNRPPVDDYEKLDHLTKGAKTADGGTVAVTLGGASSQDFDVSADVSYLAALYHHFVFSDDSVHSVVFDNTVAGYPHAEVQALVKIGGEWKEPEDWTHDEKKTFCRDIDSQRVEELVIIISNSDWQEKDAITPAEHPKLTAKSAGCGDWVGTATMYRRNTPAGPWDWDETVTATAQNVVWERVPAETDDDPFTWGMFKIVSGTVKWEVSGSEGGCPPYSGSVTVQTKDGFGVLEVSNDLTAPVGDLMYIGIASTDETLLVTMPSCGPFSPWVSTAYLGSWFDTGDQGLAYEDRSRLIGQYDFTEGSFVQRFTWDFSAAR